MGTTTSTIFSTATTTSTIATITTTTPTSTGTPTTLEIVDKACDLGTEKYLANSPGFVPSLAECAQLCEVSDECMSVTLYNSKWCSHFSSTCSSLRDSPGSTVVKFQSRSHAGSWTLKTAYGRACDFGTEGGYIGSSSQNRASLSECLDSCAVTHGCKSVVFYYSSNFCSHVSTACTLTKTSPDAVSFSMTSTRRLLGQS